MDETDISSNQSTKAGEPDDTALNPTDPNANPNPEEEEGVSEDSLGKLDETTLDERRAIGAEVNKKYEGWREPRRTHELQWFINAAYRRGKQSNESIQSLNTVQDITKLDRRKKNIANKLWAKGRARFAKFARTRPKPVVVPFNTDRKSRLDARATEHTLEYFYEKADQERKYLDVLLHAQDMGKAYWWFHWDPHKMVTIQTKDDVTQQTSQDDREEGDVTLEVDSAFSVLVPDLRQAHIGDQPEIMRVRTMDLDSMKQDNEEFKEYIKADAHLTSPFEFERQISHLSGSEAGALASMSSDMKGPMKGVLLKENYIRPNAKYPKGRYIRVMNGIAVRVNDELPFGFHDMENPYPCTEFMDMPQVGQFYVQAFIEQLIPLQRGYNMLRDKLERQIQMNTHPKWMVAKQARVAKGALTNEAGEVVEWNWIPGMPEPHTVTPGSIVADAWKFGQLLMKEFDDISSVQPVFEGKAGATKSGTQTNLLQEASDSVHSPDARGFELSFRDASYKVRRIMKTGYTVPRLLSFAGRSNIPEVYEFSQDNIDEHAAIVIQIGSALSSFKATKIQQLMELHEKGLLGDPNDPELKRRVLGMMDIGGLEQFQEEARQNEDMARMENIDMINSPKGEIPVPMFYEDHMAHYATHTEELMNPANRDLPDEVKHRMIGHVLLHMKWFNQAAAYNLAMEMGFDQLVATPQNPKGLIKPPAPPVPGQPGQGAPPPQGPQPQQPHPPGR